MTAARCPTCDKPRAGEVFVNHAAGCTCAGCLSVCWRDWGIMCEEAPRRAQALAAEADAARWRRVAPLIERLRAAEPDSPEEWTVLLELLAATTDRAAPEGATP